MAAVSLDPAVVEAIVWKAVADAATGLDPAVAPYRSDEPLPDGSAVPRWVRLVDVNLEPYDRVSGGDADRQMVTVVCQVGVAVSLLNAEPFALPNAARPFRTALDVTSYADAAGTHRVDLDRCAYSAAGLSDDQAGLKTAVLVATGLAYRNSA